MSQKLARKLACLLVLVCWALPAHGRNLVDPLTNWIQENGGRVDVKAADAADPAKGLVAAKQVAEGELIAVIPFSTCYLLPETGSSQDVAAAILKRAADPTDWYQPLWSSGLVIEGHAPLPAGIYSFPEDYLPYLSAPDLEAYVQRLQGTNLKYFEQHQEELELLGVSYQQFSRMVHIVGTKSFFYIDATYLIPLVDLATHQFRCTHYASITGCSASTKPPPQQQQQQDTAADQDAGASPDTDTPGSSSSSDDAEKVSIEGLCVAWFAGDDIAAGDQLCSTYGVSYSDEALLQFGVVMAADAYAGPELAAVDCRLFNPKQPFKYQEEGILEELEGDQDALVAEKKRLLSRIQLLDASKAVVAAAQPVPEDADGRLLEAVRSWREVRLKALKAESARVDQAIAEMWSGYDDDEGDWAEPPAVVSLGSKRERAAREGQRKVEL